jgi:hypothetical protein
MQHGDFHEPTAPSAVPGTNSKATNSKAILIPRLLIDLYKKVDVSRLVT